MTCFRDQAVCRLGGIDMDFSHPAIALAMLVTIGILTANWWAGAAFGTAFFIGRETTQAEYRWIEKYGQGKRSNMPFWGGFDPRVWNTFKPWLDWLLPTAMVLAIALILA